MATSPILPPIPYKSTMLDKTGFLTPAWSAFFRQLFALVGGNDTSSLSQIASYLTTIQSELVSQQAEISALQSTVAPDFNQGRYL